MLTPGQKLALEQLEAIAAAGDAVELLDVREPDDPNAQLTVTVSLRCSDIEQLDSGIRLKARERFCVRIPRDFPFDVPEVSTPHRRWAGTEHVQGARHLCLYLSKATEWDPADGMFGFLARLRLWLERAARSELDAAGGPMHPPVAYGRDPTLPLFVPRADTPAVGTTAWLGLAELKLASERRVDIVGWADPLADEWPRAAALAVLLPAALTWEWPTRARHLLDEFARQGVDRKRFLALLRAAAFTGNEDEPLYVVVGSPMRGTVGGETRQHLEVWHFDSAFRGYVRSTLPRPSDNDEINRLRDDLEDALVKLLDASAITFAHVREDRPEIVERRDAGSAMRWFEGTTIALWGCGALGGWIAELLVRARVRRIVLYDNGLVAPGLLVRQPYADRDVGYAKATRLRERLVAIDPAVEVDARVKNVLTSALDADDWTDGAAVVIDATASVIVAAKFERVRHERPRATPIVSMIVGHLAEQALLTLSGPSATGGPADARRRLKLIAADHANLGPFLDEFWPDPPRTDVFQPEPGCSDGTFRGSGAEVVALAASMLQAVGREFANDLPSAVAHLFALPGAEHAGVPQARVELANDLVLHDGLNDYEIRISESAIKQLKLWFVDNDARRGKYVETGGLLFGERDDSMRILWISEATGPSRDSVHSEQEFICGVSCNEQLVAERRRNGRGSLDFVGMWHTHPRGTAMPSGRDIASMTRLVLSDDPPLPKSLALIVGGTPTDPELGAYVFDRKQYDAPFVTLTFHDRRVRPGTAPVPEVTRARRMRFTIIRAVGRISRTAARRGSVPQTYRQ